MAPEFVVIISRRRLRVNYEIVSSSGQKSAIYGPEHANANDCKRVLLPCC